MNVHCGEGCNGHTNCRIEALLQDGGCNKNLRQQRRERQKRNSTTPGNNASTSPPTKATVIDTSITTSTTTTTIDRSGDSPARSTTNTNSLTPTRSLTNDDNNNNNNNANSMTSAIQQVRQLARERPNFFRDVKEQIDRDIQSRVKTMIVSKGAQEQKTKSLFRLRTNVILPTIQYLDKIEKNQLGSMFIYGLLIGGHMILSLLVCFVASAGFALALFSTTTKGVSKSITISHNVTILYAFHMAMLLLVLLVRRFVQLIHRKSKILDSFLQEVLSISSKEDLGISVQEFANRSKLWTSRITKTTFFMLLLSIGWYRYVHHNNSYDPYYGSFSKATETEFITVMDSNSNSNSVVCSASCFCV
jgi:hypothetical protein